jgi:hypothetical protein
MILGGFRLGEKNPFSATEYTRTKKQAGSLFAETGEDALLLSENSMGGRICYEIDTRNGLPMA